MYRKQKLGTMKTVVYAMYYFMPRQHVLSQRTQARETWGQSLSLERGGWERKQRHSGSWQVTWSRAAFGERRISSSYTAIAGVIILHPQTSHAILIMRKPGNHISDCVSPHKEHSEDIHSGQ